MKFCQASFGAFLLIILPLVAAASHLKGGEISIRSVACRSDNYEITLTLYTNVNSSIMAGNGILSFGDDTSMILPQLVGVTVDARTGTAKAVYVITHSYTGQRVYTISYSEANRNAGIVNMRGSGVIPFYIETTLFVDKTKLCNSTPAFTILPIDRACSGISFSHNPGASDADGDSLSYELAIPKSDLNTPVTGFDSPNASAYYSGFDYQHANESRTSTPNFSINAVTGTLTWDAPGMQGQYATAIKVSEWRKTTTGFMLLGYIVRDMQIIVEDCKNSRPSLIIPADFCGSPGDNIHQVIKGFDAESDPVTIEVFTTDNFGSFAPHVQNGGIRQSTDTAHIVFDWNITCGLVRDNPYQIILKITDDPLTGPRLSTFYTLNVKVTGAAPEYQLLTLDLAAKTFRIEWKPYVCANAPVMEVWRRVDSGPPSASTCTGGIARSLGFSKIGAVSDANVFIDKNLDPGARYCYRLVALFNSPVTSSSKVSVEECVGPIVIDAPVVTNVSVNKTHSSQGEMLLRWTSPFQIDKTQFPSPYEYDMFRTTNGTVFTKVTSARVRDTTFIDRQLNTYDITYGYKIVLYSPDGLTHNNPLDTSATAYHPRLSFERLASSIKLTWYADVPWSNQNIRYPYHYIYRGTDDATLTLIDSVNVTALNLPDTEEPFQYLDRGRYQSQALEENTVYYYRIQTRGVYGNPRIKEPLINFSNIVGAQIIDTSPPCKPLLAVEQTDCATFLKTAACNFSDFKNTLSWQSVSGCGNDVAFYTVFYRGTSGGEFTSVASVSNQEYVHALVNTFSGCYKITATDRSGNVSEESNEVCNDNCPNIFIPNVFTPLNEDNKNDVFPGLVNAASDPVKCPRFVKSLDMAIFNRWGQQVFLINNSSQGFTEWSGLDSEGKELPSGVYFYFGEILFNVVNERDQTRKLNGWVNLVR